MALFGNTRDILIIVILIKGFPFVPSAVLDLDSMLSKKSLVLRLCFIAARAKWKNACTPSKQ